MELVELGRAQGPGSDSSHVPRLGHHCLGSMVADSCCNVPQRRPSTKTVYRKRDGGAVGIVEEAVKWLNGKEPPESQREALLRSILTRLLRQTSTR
ncbi:hypothetical protein DPEC_G00064290 [Dallia pectoralis]|uniref:Uncharacterized protein n=1 Tax=Dallia pectoralis TaxID=75939 RepID=A0ACC2H7N3_DALPE|nr:hypothetical protein DPEC_G00064290 [Dallia pectoralis]